MLEAVVFDFDGVIVDTEHLHFAAMQKLVEPMGIGLSWDDYVRDLIGFDDRGAFAAILQKAGRPSDGASVRQLVEQKAGIFGDLVNHAPPDPFPGSVELIRSLSGQIPLALCTGALYSDIAPVFKALNIGDAFDVVVTADDVQQSKPDPSCYRFAVERLSRRYDRAWPASSCLAIEDTPAGITSAKGAGLTVLGLTNSYDRQYLAQADFILTTLAGVDLSVLKKMMYAP